MPLGLESSHLLTCNFAAQQISVSTTMCELRYPVSFLALSPFCSHNGSHNGAIWLSAATQILCNRRPERRYKDKCNVTVIVARKRYRRNFGNEEEAKMCALCNIVGSQPGGSIRCDVAWVGRFLRGSGA
jgi:hypothetical protein